MPSNSGRTVSVLAGGGIVFRINADSETEVLMIYRNGKWDLPKGKIEAGESIEMGAVREVAEETGCGLPTIVDKLGSTYHEYHMDNTYFAKTTYWFSMILTHPQKLTPQAEEGITEVEWVPLVQAKQKAGYENIKQILSVFETKKA